jgi:hypothetical protein
MNKSRGGRGKKLPYNSVTVRIPENLKSQVEDLVSDYRQFILDGIENNNDNIPSIDEIKQLSKQLLKSRATRKDIVIKLVMSIYGIEITDSDLV